MFASANKNSSVKDIDAFWNDAVEKTSNIPTNPDVISFDEASKLGLTPGKTMPVRLTGSLKPNEPPSSKEVNMCRAVRCCRKSL